MPRLETRRGAQPSSGLPGGEKRWKRFLASLSDRPLSQILNYTCIWERYERGATCNWRVRKLRLRKTKVNPAGTPIHQHSSDVEGRKEWQHSSGAWRVGAQELKASRGRKWERPEAPRPPSVYFIRRLTSWQGSELCLIFSACFMKPIKSVKHLIGSFAVF